MKTKPWIYVAGPYTRPDPIVNARNAIVTAIALRDLGCVPICPHLSMLAHLVSPQPYEFWMAWDFDLIAKCDAVLRLDGDSPGADQETGLAADLGIPVMRSMTSLKVWLDECGEAEPQHGNGCYGCEDCPSPITRERLCSAPVDDE